MPRSDELCVTFGADPEFEVYTVAGRFISARNII